MDIDWNNPPALPVRRKDKTDRERLAKASHLKKTAKHRGRNHWKNWERRHVAKTKAGLAKKCSNKNLSSLRKFRDAVRAYWNGEKDEHP
jgi:hypothetical protein